MEKVKITSPILFDVVLSVDSNKWFYGRKSVLTDQKEQLLMKGYIPAEAFASPEFSKEVNIYYCWVVKHEKDTAKKKARSLYIDREFLLNGNYKWSEITY